MTITTPPHLQGIRHLQSSSFLAWNSGRGNIIPNLIWALPDWFGIAQERYSSFNNNTTTFVCYILPVQFVCQLSHLPVFYVFHSYIALIVKCNISVFCVAERHPCTMMLMLAGSCSYAQYMQTMKIRICCWWQEKYTCILFSHSWCWHNFLRGDLHCEI